MLFHYYHFIIIIIIITFYFIVVIIIFLSLVRLLFIIRFLLTSFVLMLVDELTNWIGEELGEGRLEELSIGERVIGTWRV
jgi:hypothetical protein